MTAFLPSVYGWQCLLDYVVHGTLGHSGGTDNPVFKDGALSLKCKKNHSSALVKLFTTHVKLSSLKWAFFPSAQNRQSSPHCFWYQRNACGRFVALLLTTK